MESRNFYPAKTILRKVLGLGHSNIPAVTVGALSLSNLIHLFQKLGKSYWDRQAYGKARAVFSSAMYHLDPTVVSQVMCFWGNLEAKKRYVNNARNILELGLRHDPDHLSSILTLANLEARAGNVKKAQELFDRGLELDNNDSYLVNSYSQFLRNAGRRRECIAVLELYLERRKQGASISWQILGDVCVDVGSIDRARECFERGSRMYREI